jgi:hypothetical protein
MTPYPPPTTPPEPYPAPTWVPTYFPYPIPTAAETHWSPYVTSTHVVVQSDPTNVDLIKFGASSTATIVQYALVAVAILTILAYKIKGRR